MEKKRLEELIEVIKKNIKNFIPIRNSSIYTSLITNNSSNKIGFKDKNIIKMDIYTIHSNPKFPLYAQIFNVNKKCYFKKASIPIYKLEGNKGKIFINIYENFSVLLFC